MVNKKKLNFIIVLRIISSVMLIGLGNILFFHYDYFWASIIIGYGLFKLYKTGTYETGELVKSKMYIKIVNKKW